MISSTVQFCTGSCVDPRSFQDVFLNLANGHVHGLVLRGIAHGLLWYQPPVCSTTAARFGEHEPAATSGGRHRSTSSKRRDRRPLLVKSHTRNTQTDLRMVNLVLPAAWVSGARHISQQQAHVAVFCVGTSTVVAHERMSKNLLEAPGFLRAHF